MRLYPVSVKAKLPKGSPLAESNPQLISIYSGSYSVRTGITILLKAYKYYSSPHVYSLKYVDPLGFD